MGTSGWYVETRTKGLRGACRGGGLCACVVARMSSAGPQQANHSSSAGASSSSTTASNISRANPSPPMTPARQQATPPPLLQQPSVPTSLVVRGRNRELQQLNNEIQLLEVSREVSSHIARAQHFALAFRFMHFRLFVDAHRQPSYYVIFLCRRS